MTIFVIPFYIQFMCLLLFLLESFLRKVISPADPIISVIVPISLSVSLSLSFVIR